jgi:ADP-heptose:LPS heptosyltransferase
MKILIIRFSSIGDIILTTPVARCLHEQLNAEIHFLTKKSFAGILQQNPYIKKIWSFDKNVAEILPLLRGEGFEVIVDLHKNLRSWQVRWQLRNVKSFSFQKLNFEKWLFVNFNINKMPPIHIVDRYLATVAPLGIKNDGKGLDYFIPSKDEIDIKNLSENKFSAQNFVAFVIGAAHATKRLPESKIIEFCQKINLPIVLLGGKDETEQGAQIAQQSGAHIYNFCGKLNLHQSASVVRQARAVVTHDTGLMHIAAAFHKPIISIWGCTVPEFGMSPYLPNKENKILEIKELSCRPCSKIGFAKCPKGHFDCMMKQKFDLTIND